MSDRYYEEELRYLREAGREFARMYPDRAGLLDTERIGERDPNVERLFEGFAFLAGRIRRKLDDDLPEITETLVSLLWPQYMRMIPSLSILELMPQPNALQAPVTLDKGLVVHSSPVGSDNIKCQYRTCRGITVNPLTLEHAGVYVAESSRSVIRLTLRLDPKIDFQTLALDSLPLFLAGEAPVAFALYHHLLRNVQSVRVRLPGAAGEITLPARETFQAVPFSPRDTLWPVAPNAYAGYQLLQEYFAFREKFLFVELHGLNRVPVPLGTETLEIDITLQEPYPQDKRFDRNDIRLHCTPIVNLFPLETEPVVVDHTRLEYPLRPITADAAFVEVFSVDAVEGYVHGTGNLARYVPFTSFHHRPATGRNDHPERHYLASMRVSPAGRRQTFVSFGGHGVAERGLPHETVSLQITATNGMLPRKALREASIREPVGHFPDFIRLRNITPPTLPCYPPTEDRFHWRVISHLAANFMSLVDAEALKGALSLYDWSGVESNRKRIESILHVETGAIERPYRGGIVRGTQIRITLRPDHFADRGDLQLFGDILSQFFALYVSINTFSQLVFVLHPTEEVISWPATNGLQQPL